MADPLANLKGRWVKGGPSPNPGGRPKAQQETRRRIADAIENRLRNEDELVEWALNVMRGDEPGMGSEPSRAYAHRFLCEHYYGKPKEQVEISEAISPEDRAMLEALRLSPHDRRERAAELKARAVSPLPILDADSTPVPGDDQ